MISVTVGTNTSKEVTIVTEDTTLKQVFDAQSVDYSSAAVHLNGSAIKPDMLNKSFADLGITSEALLIAVQKAGNGFAL